MPGFMQDSFSTGSVIFVQKDAFGKGSTCIELYYSPDPCFTVALAVYLHKILQICFYTVSCLWHK